MGHFGSRYCRWPIPTTAPDPLTRELALTDGPARSYHRWRLWLGAVSLLLALAYLFALIITGGAVAIRDRVSAFTLHWWLELPLVLAVVGTGYRLLALPLDWLRGYWLPRRVGLLHQPFHSWLWDAAKATLIGSLLTLLAAETVYAFLRSTPWWWLWGAGVFLAGYAVLAWLAPVWLVPLFYRLAPLDDIALRDRLLRVATRAGVPVLGVWVVDQSRKSRAANAAVVGLGVTRRIVLFDTLIKEFSADEVEVVLAHEMAHHVHNDIGRGLLVQGALTLATFWLADHWLTAGTERLGLTGPADPAGLPLLGLILMGVGLISLPLANGWSRHVERQADDFALRTSDHPAAFITAMERLGALNLSERDPHIVKEILLYSHPSIGRRIARAQDLLRSSG